ncbi:hypothetical protein M0R72_21355 [Candidatus Pacearchaeota archaeon]|jgi:hypothetical protein|nr:hypothetical protein [Candidatus Pacearchaeota archaeon]
MDNDNKGYSAIYSFGLPDGLPARFTCCICGGPAISEIEINDELICDCCYQKNDHIHQEADHQYCFWKNCNHKADIAYECNGECARCIV